MDRQELETALAAIWAEVLRVDSVGPDQDFFSLGGNSLMAVRMISLVQERIGAGAPPQRLMQSRTVAELAAAMTEGAQEEEGVI